MVVSGDPLVRRQGSEKAPSSAQNLHHIRSGPADWKPIRRATVSSFSASYPTIGRPGNLLAASHRSPRQAISGSIPA